MDGLELLFDNQNDPFQMNNLAAHPAHQTTLQDYRAKMAGKMAELSDKDQPSTWYRDHWTDNNRNILRGARG